MSGVTVHQLSTLWTHPRRELMFSCVAPSPWIFEGRGSCPGPCNRIASIPQFGTSETGHHVASHGMLFLTNASEFNAIHIFLERPHPAFRIPEQIFSRPGRLFTHVSLERLPCLLPCCTPRHDPA